MKRIIRKTMIDTEKRVGMVNSNRLITYLPIPDLGSSTVYYHLLNWTQSFGQESGLG